jgi:hypothetical protein
MARLAGTWVAVFGTAAVLAAPAPAHAVPQCRYGPTVTADCPAGCVPDAGDLATPCSGPLLDPLFPPGPPVKVGIEGGIGLGS